MQGRIDAIRRGHEPLIGSLAGVAACLMLAIAPASAETQTGAGTTLPPSTSPAILTEAAGGMTVYIDPRTGAIVSKPAAGSVPLQLTPELRNALSSSHQGFVQVPSSEPGGGVKVDLLGRFQNPFIAVTDTDGMARVHHLDELPWLGEKQ